MDMNRDWTPFAADAEVEHHGTERLCVAHNALRREVAQLRSEALSRRAADDGAVVVEATIEESPQGDKFIVVELPDDFGEEGDDTCSVTIRRREVKP